MPSIFRADNANHRKQISAQRGQSALSARGDMSTTDYLMVLPVPHFRVGHRRVAVESAFAEHLRMMRRKIGDAGDTLVVASPSMRAEAYESRKQGLSIIDEEKGTISFCTLYSEDAIHSPLDKIRHFYPVMRTVYTISKQSFCIHSGLSWSVWLPFEFASILIGTVLGRRTVFVVDIDFRNSAFMSYKTGDWSWKSYLLCRLIYDNVRSLQLRIAARYCSLVMLKGRKLVADFGGGRSNVKYILDAAHSENNVIDARLLEKKVRDIRDRSQPVRLTYFGRLTAYKGIDRCLRAVATAKHSGANVQLDIIGSGEQLDALRRLTIECHADSYVRFYGSLLFNQEFFGLLYQYHLLLAAPLREDTPRSALDAMAAGIPYLAFDTYYYRELLESEAGRTVPWPDVNAMAQVIVNLERNREELVSMVEHSVEYARANTQEIWLERRFTWTLPEGPGN
jgi:glycosyltransferase involved in cell wall biosynthesis